MIKPTKRWYNEDLALCFIHDFYSCIPEYDLVRDHLNVGDLFYVY